MNFVCSSSIIFCGKKNITETQAKLDKYYGDSALSISMVQKWFTEFRCGPTSTIVAERSERPVEVAIPATIEKIRNMLLADRRLKVRKIVKAIGISHGSVVSPDLTPSDYFLFPNLKKWVGGKSFYFNDEIISHTNIYFEDLEKSYFFGRDTKIGKTLDEVYRVKI